ncbi:MAG: hypothetical protein LBO79_00620, partial [Zoogloeaceae bacterium]|nr:hypothetical protein [Zoogloeaceae bacterium]
MTATSRRDFLKSLSALSASLRQQIEAEVTGLDGAIAAIRVRREQDAIAAPRSEAKSTLVSQLFVLWRLLTGRKKYPVIVMD